MSAELLFVLAVTTLGFVIVLWSLHRKGEPSQQLLEVIKMLQSSSQEDRKVLLESLQRNTQAVNERLDNAARVIYQVQKSIGEMSEIGRSMKDLQEFLRSPKLRGNVGEQVLRELLSQMLPKQSFHLQYPFRSGTVVDAAIQTSAGLIPVDSKFPMDSFRKMESAENEKEKNYFEKEFIKDVKKHIDDISEKYILTEEGTVDYALMYVPSESIYYQIMTGSEDLVDYAYQKRVLPVSPTTFYAYLRAILMSFEGQKIEARAREVLAAIRAIQRDYLQVEDGLRILGKHIGNAYNTLSSVVNSFTHLGQRITSVQMLGKEEVKEVKEISNRISS
jgi:DNA recombination protein RmuC